MAYEDKSLKGNLGNRISFWQKQADEHKEKQLINPFSEWSGASHRSTLQKDDPNYGRPVEGSLTEHRGKQAGLYIGAEIVELCHVIADLGNYLFNS